MPATTGLSSCSAVLLIFPRPSARSVLRWRGDWPMELRICVSFSFAIAGHLPGLLGLEGQHIGDRLAARLGNVLRAAQLPQGGLGRLQHVDQLCRAERLREHVADSNK